MKSSLRPKARPKKGMKSSLRPKARPVDVSPKAERGDIELMLKEQKEKSLLRPTRDGKALTTKSYLQPRADGTGLTTEPENMKYGGKVKKMKKGGKMPDLTGDGKVTQADVLKGRGVFKKGGKVRGYGLARGGKACKMR